jgi:transcriptional regulator of arginine metabolism
MSDTSLPNTRGARLSAISQILSQKKLRSQRELAQELVDLGIDVAQPTLSRDLDDLSVTKDQAGFYVLGDVEDITYQRLSKSLRDLLISIDVSSQLCVLRTPPGGAHLLAGAIDQAKVEGVLGTIAGDDTILMITKDSNSAARITSEFLGMTDNTYRDKE